MIKNEIFVGNHFANNFFSGVQNVLGSNDDDDDSSDDNDKIDTKPTN